MGGSLGRTAPVTCLLRLLGLACVLGGAASMMPSGAALAAVAETTIDWPTGAATVTAGQALEAVGQASAAGGVAAVEVEVRSRSLHRWLRADGSWGAREILLATLETTSAATTTWSLRWTPPVAGRYLLRARAVATDGRVGRRRARVRLVAVDAPLPPPTPISPPDDGAGEIVAFCPASHRLQDDPIVFPNQPGAAHLHSFFGSTETDAFSTAEVLLRSSTTCDPAADRSAYWVPTLLENEVPIEPEQATFYYSAESDPPSSLRSLPFGLRIIAGNGSRTGPNDGPSHYTWSCRGDATSSSGDFAACPPGRELELLLNFPDCWNGVDLDSPDHKRHTAYSAGRRCPPSHPVPVPRLQFKLRYPTPGGASVRLAAGSGEHAHHDGRGWTAHGDFINAWEPAELEQRVASCLRQANKCGPDGHPLK